MKVLVASRKKQALINSFTQMLTAWFSVVGEPLKITFSNETFIFEPDGFLVGTDRFSYSQLEIFTLDQLIAITRALQKEMTKLDGTLDAQIFEATKLAAKCNAIAQILLEKAEEV